MTSDIFPKGKTIWGKTIKALLLRALLQKTLGHSLEANAVFIKRINCFALNSFAFQYHFDFYCFYPLVLQGGIYPLGNFLSQYYNKPLFY